MAAGRSSDMRIPSRPAPAPPGSTANLNNFRSGTHLLDFDNCDPFLDRKYARSETTLGEKKKPPPRPPPPKLVPKSVNRRQAPTQLLTNLFGRRSSRGNNKLGENGLASKQTTVYGSTAQTNTSAASTGCSNVQVPSGVLIDFNSPPASPTLTTRSSSDGVSVDSFGSDCVTTGINSSGSQVESGFEDDFDFFSASTTTTPTVSDPWCENSQQDPFSPRRISPHPSMPATIFETDSNQMKFNNGTASSAQAGFISRPTIIRAVKSSKPPRPPPMKSLSGQQSGDSVNSIGGNSDPNWSPPMPSQPPPPPPPEVIQVLMNGPQLPPRPTTLMSENVERKKPYCIALYDYEGTHPDDLSFRINDVITLVSRVNPEWLRGQLMGKEGMFPVNFVNIVVPLDEEPAETFENDAKVIALYTFTPETWDDLPFQEGETVRILRRINDDWLYGECKGRRGQFPSSFVSSLYVDFQS